MQTCAHLCTSERGACQAMDVDARQKEIIAHRESGSRGQGLKREFRVKEEARATWA